MTYTLINNSNNNNKQLSLSFVGHSTELVLISQRLKLCRVQRVLKHVARHIQLKYKQINIQSYVHPNFIIYACLHSS